MPARAGIRPRADAAVLMPDKLSLEDVVVGRARFGAACAATCFVSAELRLHRRIAYRLGLRDSLVGSGGGSVEGPAVEVLPLRLNARGHSRLRGRRGASVFAHVVITDAVGNMLAEDWRPVYLAR